MSKVKRVSMRAVVRNTKSRSQSVKRPDSLVRVVISELDPVRKCGPGTSVVCLFRVIEKREGRETRHLVFLDRHGWYCEHGPDCAAVALARRKAGRRVARSGQRA